MIWDLEIPDLKVQSPFQSRPNTKAARLEALKLLRKPSLREKGAPLPEQALPLATCSLGSGEEAGARGGQEEDCRQDHKAFPHLEGLVSKF